VAADRREFAAWVSQINGHGPVQPVLDYETFGEHHWADTGISISSATCRPDPRARRQRVHHSRPGRRPLRRPLGHRRAAHGVVGRSERDLSTWLGNAMQSNALHELFKLEGPLKDCGDADLLTDWRRLSTATFLLHVHEKCPRRPAQTNVFQPVRKPYDG